MTQNKQVIAASRVLQTSAECCMCGDFGLPSELFQCKICQFRSQHRSACGCLQLVFEPKDETKERSQNSSNSSSSNKTNSGDHDHSKDKRKNSNSSTDNHGGLKGQKSSLQLQLNKPIKKERSPERSPSTRKRIITNAALEEKLRRTRSEEITNRVITTKPVFRNKVRRYKLLDEVSS
ncbi:hypothetical protein JRO89_XS07G0121100 [Xanthoceras sorbifolium]|uniref:PHD-type zinc finger plants domain-containing protein n=1 Tax=Xanthoceras sorbifolium TaxID=99658 RepID=A0ABQ8HTR4_9ROSI|nr:hypothetical protein JRO89_XS07G0121100 [Xanthoceras sorbifolium]